MTYRDDREAAQARITALETELADARTRIAELEGRRSEALVLASAGALTRAGKAKLPWYGAPLRLELARTFAGALPADAFEDLIEVIRTTTGESGRSELLRASLTWEMTTPSNSAGPFTQVRVAVRDGATTLTLTDRLGQLAGAIYGGVGGGVGGGGIALPIVASIAMPALAPVFAATWLGGTFLGTRALFKWRARKRAELLQRTFDAVAAEIERRLAAAAAADR